MFTQKVHAGPEARDPAELKARRLETEDQLVFHSTSEDREGPLSHLSLSDFLLMVGVPHSAGRALGFKRSPHSSVHLGKKHLTDTPGGTFGQMSRALCGLVKSIHTINHHKGKIFICWTSSKNNYGICKPFAKETSCIYQTLDSLLLDMCPSRDHDNVTEEVGGRATDKNSNWKLININSLEKARKKCQFPYCMRENNDVNNFSSILMKR